MCISAEESNKEPEIVKILIIIAFSTILLKRLLPMEENRQRQFFDAELNGRDQRDAEDNSMDVDVQVDGERDDEDGEETKQEQQQSNGIAESLSTSSDNSDNESLRSRVPRVNCPEHLVSGKCARFRAEVEATGSLFQFSTLHTINIISFNIAFTNLILKLIQSYNNTPRIKLQNID